MSHGLLWLPLLLVFVLLTALGWLERRRQRLFREWAEGSELAKLDSCAFKGTKHQTNRYLSSFNNRSALNYEYSALSSLDIPNSAADWQHILRASYFKSCQ